MIGLDLVLFMSVAAYIAWSIGANDETMMIAASGSSLSTNRLAVIGAIATCAGAIACGQIVEETIGKGILAIPATSRVGLQIVIATASWLSVVSWFGWPISTSHSTIGAVIGYGVYAHGIGKINWQNLNGIFFAWLISPIFGFLASYFATRLLMMTGNTDHSSSKRWVLVLLLVAVVQEFWQGANNVSNATAFLSTTFEYPLFSRIMGGICLAVGLLTIGRRVIFAAGIRITRLPVGAALVTQTAIVLINAVGTLYGLPLSGTHLSVGCLVGAGVATKSRIDYRMCRNVILYWFLTLPGAAFFSVLVAHVSSMLFPT